jgi:hypothetical protein
MLSPGTALGVVSGKPHVVGPRQVIFLEVSVLALLTHEIEQA